MSLSFSLEEYRLRYPNTAGIPTITQQGLIGRILQREQRKMARLARRQAVWNQAFRLPGKAIAAFRRALTFPAFHPSPALHPVETFVARPARQS